MVKSPTIIRWQKLPKRRGNSDFANIEKYASKRSLCAPRTILVQSPFEALCIMIVVSDCPYGEYDIEILSVRDSVLKRPGMYFGDLHDGTAYAGTIQVLVHAALSWQIGANVGIRLKSNNEVELYCYGGLPQGDKPHVHRWGRPIEVITKELGIMSKTQIKNAA